MIISQIVAIAKNRVMGINNTLPWHLPEDMKFFREKTKGHIMIMGRKTFESLGNPLPNRFHFVITSQKDYEYIHPQVKVVHSLNEAIEESNKIQPSWPQEVFIIGGSGVFNEAFPITNKIYLTMIDKDFQGDVIYPELPSQFIQIEKKDITGEIPFSFTTWINKSSKGNYESY